MLPPSIGHDFLLWYAPELQSASQARRWVLAPPPAPAPALAALQALLAALTEQFPLDAPVPIWIDDPAYNPDIGTLGLLVEHAAADSVREFLRAKAAALGVVCCDLTADILYFCDGSTAERAMTGGN